MSVKVWEALTDDGPYSSVPSPRGSGSFVQRRDVTITKTDCEMIHSINQT